MQKSLDIFKAEPQSVFDVICERKTTGFYMPAYQRPYSWEESHIKDLFSDFDNVVRNLLDSPDAIIFLGSILSVDDSSADTVFPIAKRQHPSSIKLIIDGQQRLTTILLIILCINEKINLLLPNLKRAIEKEQDEDQREVLDQLRQIVLQLEIDTSNTVIDTPAEHAVYKFLPKIIRSQVDCWGRDEKKACYESPLAELICAYQRHKVESTQGKKFYKFDLSKISNNAKRISENVKTIRNLLDCIEKGFEFGTTEDGNEDRIEMSDLVKAETLDICLDFPIDKELQQATETHPKIAEIVYITLFSKFLLHRVCLTYVEVNNESYAFDMFEALNTTGEPLTAIETFVPKVIEHIGKKRKDGVSKEIIENSIKKLNSITERFEGIIKVNDKNSKTKSLIIAFVRAYEGKVKVGSLRNQREAMIKSYESCHYNLKDQYLEQLARTTDFLFDHWQARVPNVGGLVELSEQEIANLCLRYLVDIKHEIVQSLLVQFILLDEKYDVVGTKDSSFIKVLKSITALSVIWRAMTGGADGIDSVYKKLHEKGVLNGEDGYQLGNGELTFERFNPKRIASFFKRELESKIISKGSAKNTIEEKWLDICSKQQTLTKPKSVKLLVLAGMHGIELKDSGYEISDKESTNFFTTSMWEIISTKDILKKVYAGGAISGWDDPLIENPEEFNKIGNVLIDPRNSFSFDNQFQWHNIKRQMLNAMSNDSVKNLDSILSSVDNPTAVTKSNASVLMLEKKFEDITYAEKWDKKAIDERSMLLLRNAWRNLIKWLEWE